MNQTSTIGMSFLEKLITTLFPVVLGIIGWFFPKLLNVLSKIPILSDSKVIKLLQSFNPFWVSIILMIVGIIIGILLSLEVYNETLKMEINDQEILIKKDNKEIITKKADIKEIYMEDNEVVIISKKGQELLRETTDINKEEIRNIFTYHHYPWCDHDPYADEYILWTLENQSFGEKINSILYERRNAIRDGDKKKANHLKKDLGELGIIVKDRNGNQYVRSFKKY